MRRVVGAGACVLALVAFGALPASAWTADGAGAGGAHAATLAQGSTPTANALGSLVSVSWSATTLPDGAPVQGYDVNVYDAGTGLPRIIGPTCSGLVTTTSCVELTAPDGEWEYAVVPRQGFWFGPESAHSAPVVVDTTAPEATDLTLVHGGGPDGIGVLDPDADEVTITYSEPLAVDSICSTWSGDLTDQSLDGLGVVVTVSNDGDNDVLTVTSTDCTLHIGEVALGGNYVLLTSQFSGIGPNDSTVKWNASTRTLTVHIGDFDSGLLNTVQQDPGLAVYSPDTAITDRFGNNIGAAPFLSFAQRF